MPDPFNRRPVPFSVRCRGVRAGALVTFVCLLLSHCAHASLLFYDGFDYAAGVELGGTPETSPPWENDKSQFTIAAGSLHYPGLQDSSGNRVSIASTSPSLDSVRTTTDAWPEQTDGTIYISFLLQLQSASGIDATGTGSSLLTLSQAANNSQLLGINLLNDGALRLGVLKYPSDSGPVSSAFFTSGTGAVLSAEGAMTCLVVAKYEWVAGSANDAVTLWVNPDNLGATEDPGNNVSTSAGTDGLGSAGRITLSRGPNILIDELRIGQTWADVTPRSGSAIPQQPVITESFFSLNGLVLRGTNGTPNGLFRTVTSQDILQPVTDWSPISTNRFDSLGNFDATNATAAGSLMSYYRLLLGGELPTPPSITTHPVSQNVLEGENLVFRVTATGTEPLVYQWHLDGAPIPGALNNSYRVLNAQTQDAGAYHVVITNSVGSVTSAVAHLIVVPEPPVDVPEGYAAVGGGTTGGSGGPTVRVDNLTDLQFYADNDDGPYTILVNGTIHLGTSNVRVRNDKTIIGLGADTTLVGNLKVYQNDNVIIRNITLTNPDDVGDGDGLSLQDCRHVWVDHCTFADCADGALDIGHAADWITVSWCHFYYTDPNHNHRFANLIGHSDNNAAEDTGRLHITYHHNWWGQLVRERMPRVRFGRVHVYNNYFNSPGNNYCIRAARDCELLVENNHFDSVKNVWELYRTIGEDGKVFATGNVQVKTTWSSGDSDIIQIPGTDLLSSDPNGLNPPPYSYTLDAAADVPASITENAGAGKGPFAP